MKTNQKKSLCRDASGAARSEVSTPNLCKESEAMKDGPSTTAAARDSKEDWTVVQWWPDLFILKSMVDASGAIIFNVTLDVGLDARFSALSKGITNRQTALMHTALWKLHLLDLDKTEFGDALNIFRGQVIEADGMTKLSELDPFYLERFDDIVKISQLLTAALFPDLRSIVHRCREDKRNASIRKMANCFRDALNGLGQNAQPLRKKKSKRTYAYSNRQVSLPWLAIRCAWEFVQKEGRLPAKLELRDCVQNNTPEESISDSTWSDAIETAGLSALPEAKKFSSKILGKKRVRKK
ncbi:hypothetical protein [Prosthecobacter sp.]|jgi:hypothetical protein|uniref:hypothetical protein n=1 Tax=Prosthecobacter sp. TaxID=1965333 RepID=UPI0037C5DD96